MTSKEVSRERKELHVPPMEEVVKVLQDGLSKNFANVSVAIVDCPDLTQKPYFLASEGLCGSPRMADIGGVPYLVPLVKTDKIYDLEYIGSKMDVAAPLMIGAGAGPVQKIEKNSEMMTNIKLGEDFKQSNNNTFLAKLDKEDQKYELMNSPYPECAVLMNIFVCEGKPGKVLEVKASNRTGSENYMTCIRKTLAEKYKDQAVGLGGTFNVGKGKLKIHVMPHFSKVPLMSNEDVDNWLKFFEMSAPFTCVGTLISSDPGLDLRVEHFHGYSEHGDGGHYHYDTTPSDVEYTGYFNIAEFMYRFDRPTQTHMVGRD